MGLLSRISRTRPHFLRSAAQIWGTVALASLLFASPLAAQRVVAVGDVHGDFDSFAAILRQAGLIDAQNRWAGGTVTLVQTGDVLDRGAKSRAVLDLLMRLEPQANKAGGRVIVLLGNHEVMNLTGDLRYTSAGEFASYADAGSERRRQHALEDYKKWAKAHGTEEFTPAMESEWLTKHPLGYIEHREAFGSQGKYGQWLRTRPATYVTGGTVFVHAGISPGNAMLTPEQISEHVASDLKEFDRSRGYLLAKRAILPFFSSDEMVAAAQQLLAAPPAQPVDSETRTLLQHFVNPQSWLAVNRDGPLWFRGYADWSDEAGAADISNLLRAMGASRFVVGHSTKAGRILARWDNKVFLIDTGMNAADAPGGRASALEINGGQVTAIYTDGRVVLAPAAAQTRTPNGGGQESPAQAAAPLAGPPHVWLGPDGNPLPFKSDGEVLEFLRTAKVVEDKGIPVGITGPRKLTLEKEGVRVHAVWRQIDEEKPVAQMGLGSEMFFRDSYIFEPAAYEMSQLLGLNNVPPAVLRKYQGAPGSLQIWVEKGMTELDRVQKNLQPPDDRYWKDQMNRMNVFDQLIYNTDRNRGNMVITPEWNVWLIDHTRAFRRIDKLLNEKAVTRCERTMFEKMRALDEPTLQQHLGPYLRKIEIKSLLKRRDIIVGMLNKMAAEKPEAEVIYTMSTPNAGSAK